MIGILGFTALWGKKPSRQYVSDSRPTSIKQSARCRDCVAAAAAAAAAVAVAAVVVAVVVVFVVFVVSLVVIVIAFKRPFHNT